MNIREIRQKKGLTLIQLSEKSGVSYGQLQSVEIGKIKLENMTLRNVTRICNALGVKIEDIYGGGKNDDCTQK